MKLGVRLSPQIWFGVVAIGLLLAFAWVATERGPLAPVRVTVTQVVSGEVAPVLFGVGTVEAQRAYAIGPTAAGRVRRVLVDVGDTVAAGQLLAEMEPVDLDTRVASAVAAASRGQSAVSAAEAQLHEAKSRQDLASLAARRHVALGGDGLVSQSEVDAALQAERAADALVAAAEAALASARRDVARLEADIGSAREQRGNIRLTAPADGVVTSRDAEAGSTVVAGQPVLRMEDPRSLWIHVRLDQRRSAGLRVGLRATITRRADPATPVAGEVVRVEPTSDAVTEERLAKVAFDEGPDGVSAGEMAEVTLHLPSIANALVVPNASLRHRGVEPGVWRHEGGAIRFAPVKIGAEAPDGSVQVLEGLQVGDEVVVYSERDLDDGSRITVVPFLRRPSR